MPAPGLRRGPVPVQGHDAALGLQQQPVLPRPRGDAGERGAARSSWCNRMRQRWPDLRQQDRRASWAWRSRPTATTRASRSPTSCKKILELHAAQVLTCDPYVEDDARSCPEREVLDAGRPLLHRRAAQALQDARLSAASPWSTSGTISGKGGSDLKALVTGSAGFIAGYLVEELLAQGTRSSGSTTTRSTARSRRATPSTRSYRFVEGDAKDVELLKELVADCDHFVAGAAMIGGISYFHEFAYDLLAENERIIAADVRRGDLGVQEQEAAEEDHGALQPHGVRERRRVYPTPEGAQLTVAAAAVHLRLPEAGVRVLRAGRPRAVQAAVHDRAALQLRRHRRAAGHGDPR